jgi:hypothetical protein
VPARRHNRWQFRRAGGHTVTEQKKRPGPLDEMGATVGRTLADLDKDAERLISYLNEEVVPSIRKHSTTALRTAARELTRFADYMERTRKK